MALTSTGEHCARWACLFYRDNAVAGVPEGLVAVKMFQVDTRARTPLNTAFPRRLHGCYVIETVCFL